MKGMNVLSCGLCENWSVDTSPWISCRTITWPRPIAQLMFYWHRHRAHTPEELEAWRKKWRL